MPLGQEEGIAASLIEHGQLAPDACIAFLEDYDEAAQERAAKRASGGLPPRRNCRGGETAMMPIYRGLETCRKKLGLPFWACLSAPHRRQ